MESLVNGLQQKGHQAMRLAAAGQHEDAIMLWEQMHRERPDHAGISLALGAALLAGGRIDHAEQWLVRCCHLHPSDAALSRLLGRVLMSNGKREPAIGAFYHSLSIEPDHGATHAELASALYWHRRSDAALPHAVLGCQAEMTELSLSTYVCILIDLGMVDQALALIETVLASDAMDRGLLLLYRSNILRELDRPDEALDAARASLRHSPDNGVAKHSLAVSLLLTGELTSEAWMLYEGRSALTTAWPMADLRWTDQDVRGRTVLVHAEQGLGDTLQFIRYVPLVAALGARVIVAVQPALVGLLQGTPGAAEVIAAGSLPPFDYYIPMLSLPGMVGTTLETIPELLPYAGLALSRSLPSPSSRRQVGIVWAGRSTFVEDRKRSIAPAMLAPLAGAAVDFHSLQLGADILPLPGMEHALLGVVDFAQTAERIAGLDLVICVDTAVAHLAATMGKPVWVLARYHGCWRWLKNREDSPWYPTVRLFRQPALDDWASVMERVRVELDRFAAAPAATALAA